LYVYKVLSRSSQYTEAKEDTSESFMSTQKCRKQQGPLPSLVHFTICVLCGL
jgi:hypothetical protein